VFQNLLRVVLNIYTLVFMAVYIPAIRLFANNIDHFKFSMFEFVVAIAVFSVIFAVPLIAVALPRRLRQPIYILTLALFIASVGATNFLPISLRVIEGGKFVDLELRHEALVFFTICLIGGALLIIAGAKFSKINRPLFSLFRFAQVFGLAFILVVTFQGLSKGINLYALSGEHLKTTENWTVSSKRNIFVLSFDQVQGSFLQTHLAERAELRDVFDGFVQYSDAVSTYPNTQYSIPQMVMGRIVERSSELMGWAMGSPDSILAHAKKNSFDVRLSPFVAGYDTKKLYTCIFCDSQYEKSFNFAGTYNLLRHSVNLGFGLDIARYGLVLPLNINGSREPSISHLWHRARLNEFDAFSRKITVGSEQPVMHFMHWAGTHQPFMYKSNCFMNSAKAIASRQNIKGAKETMGCVIKILGQLFSRLKEFGLYDSSMLIITSDHGFERNINNFALKPKERKYFGVMAEKMGDIRNIKPLGSYDPILLFKDFKATGKLRTNNSPVSLIDIAPTVCAAMEGCSARWQGISLRADAPRDRERFFWLFLGSRMVVDGEMLFHNRLDTWEKRSFTGPIYPNMAYAMGVSKGRTDAPKKQRSERLVGASQLAAYMGGRSNILVSETTIPGQDNATALGMVETMDKGEHFISSKEFNVDRAGTVAIEIKLAQKNPQKFLIYLIGQDGSAYQPFDVKKQRQGRPGEWGGIKVTDKSLKATSDQEYIAKVTFSVSASVGRSIFRIQLVKPKDGTTIYKGDKNAGLIINEIRKSWED